MAGLHRAPPARSSGATSSTTTATTASTTPTDPAPWSSPTPWSATPPPASTSRAARPAPLVRDNVTMDNAVGSTRTVGDIRVDASSIPGASLDRDLVFQTAAGGTDFEWAGTNYATPRRTTASGQEAHGINAARPPAQRGGARPPTRTATRPPSTRRTPGFTAWAPPTSTATRRTTTRPSPTPGNGPDAVADLGALEYAGPAAIGSATPTTGFAPLDVAVNGSASTSLGAPIDSYSWEQDATERVQEQRRQLPHDEPVRAHRRGRRRSRRGTRRSRATRRRSRRRSRPETRWCSSPPSGRRWWRWR